MQQYAQNAIAQNRNQLHMSDFIKKQKTLQQPTSTTTQSTIDNIQQIPQGTAEMNDQQSPNDVQRYSKKAQDPRITTPDFYKNYQDNQSFPAITGHIPDHFYQSDFVYRNESIESQRMRENEMAESADMIAKDAAAYAMNTQALNEYTNECITFLIKNGVKSQRVDIVKERSLYMANKIISKIREQIHCTIYQKTLEFCDSKKWQISMSSALRVPDLDKRARGLIEQEIAKLIMLKMEKQLPQ